MLNGTPSSIILECPTTGSYDVSSVVNKSSSTSAPDDPILPETSVTVAAETIGNSQNPESSPPSTTGTLVSTKTDPVPISVTSQTTVCSPEKPGQVASSGTPLDTSCCKGMASVSPLVSETSSQRISSEAKDNRYKKEMFGPESPLRRKGAEQAAKVEYTQLVKRDHLSRIIVFKLSCSQYEMRIRQMCKIQCSLLLKHKNVVKNFVYYFVCY